MKWGQFIQSNIDKLILILVLYGLLIMILDNTGSPALVDWLKNEAGTVLGALLTLITSRVVGHVITSSPNEPADQSAVQPSQEKKQ
jgi:hypothetical protein